jgi:hypothetical protein
MNRIKPLNTAGDKQDILFFHRGDRKERGENLFIKIQPVGAQGESARQMR